MIIKYKILWVEIKLYVYLLLLFFCWEQKQLSFMFINLILKIKNEMISEFLIFKRKFINITLLLLLLLLFLSVL